MATKKTVALPEGWQTFTMRRAPMLVAGRPVIAAWGGSEPGDGWVLHYWGHPLTGRLPEHLQPNGAVGHQYLTCADPAAVIERYGEICAALRAKVPGLELHGPEPGASDLMKQLAKKQTYFRPPKDNGMTLALERATALLAAEHALAGDNEEAASARVFATPSGGEAIVTGMDGGLYVASRDGAIAIVACPKASAKQALATAFDTGDQDVGVLTIVGTEVVLASARASGDELAADLKKGAALVVPCDAGRYAVRAGYEYPVGVLRLARA